MRGFSLVETAVALLLLMVALLLGLGLVLQEPRIVRRLDAKRHALQAVEATLEALRAGTMPLESADLPAVAPRWPALAVEVESEGVHPGLYRVRVRARYSANGVARDTAVETLLWRPVAP